MSSVVPEGWELSPLSALADYKNGRAFKPSDWSKSGLPILRIAQINNPHKVDDYYDGNDIDDGHFITKGDLIFSWSATLKAEIWSHYDAVLNQHIFKVTEKVGTNRIYLQQLIDYAIPKLAESSHGSTMKHIKKGVLDEFFSPIPPLSEQKKIASILTSVDEVIENTQKQIDKLQDLKKATMNELLTKGIGHTEFKDSELGLIPKSWEISSVEDLLTPNCLFSDGDWVESKDQDPAGTNRLLQLADIGDGRFVNKSNRFMNDEQFNRLNCTQLQEGDVLIARMPEPIGRACILPRLDNRLATVVDIAILRPSAVDSYWLMSVINSAGFRTKIEEQSTGTTRTRIGRTALSKIKLLSPPLPEQKKIASILTSMDKTIEEKQRKRAQTQCLKKSLMQDLLTGRVRVNL